jgi:hypothetical protein
MFYRNPLSGLDDLPDLPKLGLKLLGAGLACLAVRIGWPHLAGDSHHAVSAAFMRFENSLVFWGSKPGGEIRDFDAMLARVAEILIVSGTFIFFRRGVWWWQERKDERSVTRLILK